MRRTARRGVLIVGAILVALGPLFAAYVVRPLIISSEPTHVVTITFEVGPVVTLELTRTHPYFAEYNRRVTVEHQATRHSFDLPSDPGGSVPMQVRLHADPVASGRVVLVFTGVDDYAFDVGASRRVLFDEGKFAHLEPHDPRLPPLWKTYVVAAHGEPIEQP